MAEDSDVMLLEDLSDKELGRLTAHQILELGIELRSARVLLADADAMIREYVGTILENLGMEVVYATTPGEAEDALRLGGCALVLVDFAEDPDVGFRTLEGLKRIGSEAGIVLFTADERVVATIAAKFDPPPDLRAFWLPKPFDLEGDFIPVLVAFLGAPVARR